MTEYSAQKHERLRIQRNRESAEHISLAAYAQELPNVIKSIVFCSLQLQPLRINRSHANTQYIRTSLFTIGLFLDDLSDGEDPVSTR